MKKEKGKQIMQINSVSPPMLLISVILIRHVNMLLKEVIVKVGRFPHFLGNDEHKKNRFVV